MSTKTKTAEDDPEDEEPTNRDQHRKSDKVPQHQPKRAQDKLVPKAPAYDWLSDLDS